MILSCCVRDWCDREILFFADTVSSDDTKRGCSSWVEHKCRCVRKVETLQGGEMTGAWVVERSGDHPHRF